MLDVVVGDVAARLEPRHAGGAQPRAPGVGRLRDVDQRVLREIGGPAQRRIARGELRAAHREEVEIDDRLAVQAFPGAGAEADRHVDRVAREVGVAQRGLELDRRRPGARASKSGRFGHQPALAERLERAHAQRARRRPERILRRLELRERDVDGREVAPALVGEREARVQPLEERDAEVLLERLDLPAERRRRDVQLLPPRA